MDYVIVAIAVLLVAVIVILFVFNMEKFGCDFPGSFKYGDNCYVCPDGYFPHYNTCVSPDGAYTVPVFIDYSPWPVYSYPWPGRRFARRRWRRVPHRRLYRGRRHS